MARVQKTDAELAEQAERQALDALAQTPEPVAEYLTGSAEEDERQAEAEAQALVRELDQQSDASERARVIRLEEAMAEQSALIVQLMKEIKGMTPITPQIIAATEMPQKKRQWTEEELRQKVTVIIFPDTDPNQNKPVMLAPNGERRYIPRGVPTSIPRYVALVLEEATIEEYYHLPKGQYEPKADATPMTLTDPSLAYKRTPRFNWAYA